MTEATLAAVAAEYDALEWDTPIPLDAGTVPPFPLDVFPAWLENMITAEADFTQTDPALPAQIASSIIAAAVQRKVEVVVKPGYAEPLSLYTCTAADPGERKSAVLSRMVNPLVSFEGDECDRLAPELEAARSERRILEKRLTIAESLAAKETADGREREQARTNARRIARELAERPPEVSPRLWTDNVTPEQLEQMLSEHGGRMAVLSAEADLLDVLGGLYNRGVANFGVFLRGHAGDDLAVDRVTRGAQVRRPALSVAMTMQCGVLTELAQQRVMQARGLLARFLWAVPLSRVGHRAVDTNPVPDDVGRQYDANMRRLLQTPYSIEHSDAKPVAHQLTLEADARAAWFRFGEEIELDLGEGGALEAVRFWGSKLAGAVVRLAGLLHMAEHVCNSKPWTVPISATTMDNAIRLGRFYIPHARAAFGIMHADPKLAGAQRVLRWLERTGAETFTVRDAHNTNQTAFPRAQDVREAVGLLAEHGYVRQIPSDNSKRGRPSEVYAVNPLWLVDA